MEDDKIRTMFQNFEPELSSDFNFMARLERSMNAVELVKQQNEALRLRNKTAVAIACAFGFVLGIISTLLFPILANWLSGINFSLPEFHIASLTFEPSIVGGIIMASVCVILTLNVYELALAKLTTKET